MTTILTGIYKLTGEEVKVLERFRTADGWFYTVEFRHGPKKRVSTKNVKLVK